MLTTPSGSKSSELTDKQLLMLFPTPMFMGRLPDIGLCDRIEKHVRGMRDATQGRSSPKNASPAFITSDNLHTVPEMKDLVDVVMGEAGKIFDAYAIKRDSHYITSMWANITHPNHRQNMHVHPNCLLSGLVYIKTPLSCGPTMFASPRKFTKNLEPRYLTKNELNSDFVIIPAEKGRMLFWPSHIPHAVEQGTADESDERIVVAFNVMIRGQVDLFTANINFA
ncbi:MAG: TIGR02466 family protein [Pseudolabrys sp.]